MRGAQFVYVGHGFTWVTAAVGGSEIARSNHGPNLGNTDHLGQLGQLGNMGTLGHSANLAAFVHLGPSGNLGYTLGPPGTNWQSGAR